MRRLLATLLLLTACEEDTQTGRSDTIRWFTFPELEQPTDEVLAEVEDIWGLELVESESPAGSVTFFYGGEEDDTSWAGGWSCTPFVYITRPMSAQTIAHEIGHAFFLEHVDDTDNLMHELSGSGTELTEEQIDTVREKLWETEKYCRL